MSPRDNASQEVGAKPATPTLRGYPSFAAFIEQDQDAQIYRKFGSLSARSLLYQQSKLHALHLKLQELDNEDSKFEKNEDARKAARDWSYYCDESNPRARKQQALQREIKQKINEYRT
jgi:hypothetical protein